MKYTVNPDNTVNTQFVNRDTEFSRRLQEIADTTNAELLLVECPEMFKFDGHKFGK